MFLNKKRYPRTDLACEIISPDKSYRGIKTEKYEKDGFEVSVTDITDEKEAKRIGKPCGIYATVFTGKTRALQGHAREMLISLISELVGKAVFSVTEKKNIRDLTALIAGIGNRRLTADAVGPFVADRVTVTRELKYSNADLFSRLECADVSSVSPGVAAETGIEAADIVKAAAKAVGADVIILVDALAAMSCERLASTVQISNTGTSPGSGIGNKRTPIDSSSMEIPVVTVGVPTVVDSSTLVYCAIRDSGLDPDTVDGALFTNGNSFFVSPQDTDIIVDDMSDLLASAFDDLFGTR